MSSIRVTQQLLISRVLNNVSRQQRSILRLQDQLATGRRVNSPSDDPLSARRAVSAQTEILKNEQYLSNISTARPVLQESETALTTVVNAIQRANELTLQGATSTNGQTQRDQLALEINQIAEGVLSQANHLTNDRFVFGGTRTGSEPFVATRSAAGEITSVEYVGNDETISTEISEGVRVPTNASGEDIFGETISGTTDVFQMLINIRDNLRAGDLEALQSRLDELDRAQDQVLLGVSRTGAVQNRLDTTEDNLRTVSVQLEQVVSDNVDADLAEVIVELNAQTNAFQASLNAGARVIQPSLLDFIR